MGVLQDAESEAKVYKVRQAEDEAGKEGEENKTAELATIQRPCD